MEFNFLEPTFWNGVLVNVITFPLAILAALYGLSRQRRDREKQEQKRRVALLQGIEVELKNNKGIIQQARPIVKEQKKVGPLTIGSNMWDAARSDIMSIDTLDNPVFKKFINNAMSSYSGSSSAREFMDFAVQLSITNPQGLLLHMNTLLNSLDISEQAIDEALGSLDEYRESLTT